MVFVVNVDVELTAITIYKSQLITALIFLKLTCTVNIEHARKLKYILGLLFFIDSLLNIFVSAKQR